MAFQTLCKQRYLAEGESVPFTLDGREVIVLWPDGGQPRAFDGLCPHEGQSLVNNSDFNGRILVCTVHGWVFNGRDGQGPEPHRLPARRVPACASPTAWWKSTWTEAAPALSGLLVLL